MNRGNVLNYGYLKDIHLADKFCQKVLTSGDNGLIAQYGRENLYFFIRYILGRKDINHQWLYERCCEVGKKPDWCIDIWPREHCKSSIITWAKTIQDIAINPEETICLFSSTRANAKKFLRQIMNTLEQNKTLSALYPEIFYQNPEKEAQKWSENDGITVKRESYVKEGTIEAWGLDSLPTGSHYSMLIFDDVVDAQNVTTAEQKSKIEENFALALNLTSRGYRVRVIGTRYAYDDYYAKLLVNKLFTPRVYTATDNGKIDGNPVFLTKEDLDKRRAAMNNDYVFSCQMLQNPLALSTQTFNKDWIKYYEKVPEGKNLRIYISADPANSRRKGADYTVYWVIAACEDGNIYILDGVKDRISLTDRGNKILALYKKYNPILIGYEQYGMQADISYLREIFAQENLTPNIVEINSKVKKEDRIRQLIPLFQAGKIHFPKSLVYVNSEQKYTDIVDEFLYEYEYFPAISHDDMLDSLAHICNEKFNFSFPPKNNFVKEKYYDVNFDL